MKKLNEKHFIEENLINIANLSYFTQILETYHFLHFVEFLGLTILHF
jgi:hypothetical protein